MRYLFLLCLLVCNLPTIAKKPGFPAKRKTTCFVSWGYNREKFTRSSIHFSGPDYNFRLRKVFAEDRPSVFSLRSYFSTKDLSIPQYNFSAGIILRDQWIFSIGQDHMKYVVKPFSNAILDGYIHNNTEFAGDYDHVHIQVIPRFLEYEHTDGLNYLHASAGKLHQWLSLGNGKLIASTLLGIHAGVLVPRSDVTLMRYNRNNTFHVAGYGLGLNAAVRITLLHYFFFRLEAKSGYIDLPNVLTRGIQYTDRASQAFGFLETIGAFGFQCRF